MLKNRLIYVCVLIGEIVLFSMWIGALAIRLLVFTLLVAVFSLVILLVYSRTCKVEIISGERMERGGVYTPQIEVISKYPLLASSVFIFMSVNEPGEQEAETVYCLNTGTDGTFFRVPSHCGRMTLELETMRIYDHLGLFCVRKKITTRSDIAVMPVIGESTRDLTAAEFVLGRSSSEAYELRDYRPGDPLRMVHWKLSQKTDRLLIKEPQSSENIALVMTIDIRQPGDEFDAILDELISSSVKMIEQGLNHLFVWRDKYGIQTAKISNINEMYNALELILYTEPCGKVREDDISYSVPVYHFGADGRGIYA